MSAAKAFNIPKKLVAAAFRAVKNSAGGAGIDKETIGQFESKLKDNLYKVWNRMSSGTYFPPGESHSSLVISGTRRSRHWPDRTASSDAAMLSQLPCLGV